MSAIGASTVTAKRIDRAVVKFLDTLGARVGYDEAHLDEVLFRDASAPMNSAPLLFTGEKRVVFPKGWDTAARVMVVQTQPLPCTVAAVVPRVTVNEA